MDTPTYRNIAIIRLSALGDIVHTIPAFALLREAFPDARISWFVNPIGAKLLANFPDIDDIVELDLKGKGLWASIKSIKPILKQYRGTFDLILDCQGLVKSGLLTWLLRGKKSVGFHKENLRESIAGIFYKKTVDFFDDRRHVILKNIHLMETGSGASFGHVRKKKEAAIGIDTGGDSGDDIDFDTCGYRDPGIDWSKVRIRVGDLSPFEEGLGEFFAGNGLKRDNFIIVNVGAGWETKRLPTSQLIEIINEIKERYDIVVLWGNEEEKVTAEEVVRETGTVMADFFSFSELILLIRYARVVVTGDTLALHLADLVSTLCVGYFGPTSPARNGSLMKGSIAICKNLSCGFCYKRKCGKIECIEKIDSNEIIEAIGKTYEASRNHY